MGEIVCEALVQPVDGLHMLLANAAGESPVPGTDGRCLDCGSRSLGTRTGSANHLIDFFLAQDLFHGAFLLTPLAGFFGSYTSAVALAFAGRKKESKPVAAAGCNFARQAIPITIENCLPRLQMHQHETRYWSPRCAGQKGCG